eukprot:GHVU01140287.1.p1 GENE.GHVU01140287.1~~GHVU01140287.1.p1  ORF type:complete len:116 (+),score=7.18 GHVU01140287.1:349-696(+)
MITNALTSLVACLLLTRREGRPHGMGHSTRAAIRGAAPGRLVPAAVPATTTATMAEATPFGLRAGTPLCGLSGLKGALCSHAFEQTRVVEKDGGRLRRYGAAQLHDRSLHLLARL